jgi:hypothetical protein
MPDKYRCFVPGGLSSNPCDRTVPVSIGCNEHNATATYRYMAAILPDGDLQPDG